MANPETWVHFGGVHLLLTVALILNQQLLIAGSNLLPCLLRSFSILLNRIKVSGMVGERSNPVKLFHRIRFQLILIMGNFFF